MSPSQQMDIMRLGLRGVVLEFAKELAKAHPDVVFTSGLRMRADQARAMAQNIAVAGHDWVTQTYRPSVARTEVIKFLAANDTLKTVDAIAIGLDDVFEHMTNDEMSKLSKHMSGDAVDIQPVEGISGEILRRAIVSLAAKHGLRFLQREGGLKKWHLQTR